MELKFNKKTSLIFLVLTLVVFIGFVLYNKKVEGMNNNIPNNNIPNIPNNNIPNCKDAKAAISAAMNLMSDPKTKNKTALIELFKAPGYNHYLKIAEVDLTDAGKKCMNMSMVQK